MIRTLPAPPTPTRADKERVKLLSIVAKEGIKKFSMTELEKLQILVEKKDYSHNKKAHKSKVKLLAEISVQIYKLQDEIDGPAEQRD